jgi:hypothetical protein
MTDDLLQVVQVRCLWSLVEGFDTKVRVVKSRHVKGIMVLKTVRLI